MPTKNAASTRLLRERQSATKNATPIPAATSETTLPETASIDGAGCIYSPRLRTTGEIPQSARITTLGPPSLTKPRQHAVREEREGLVTERRAEQVLQVHLAAQALDLVEHGIRRSMDRDVAHVARHPIAALSEAEVAEGQDRTMADVGVRVDDPANAALGDGFRLRSRRRHGEQPCDGNVSAVDAMAGGGEALVVETLLAGDLRMGRMRIHQDRETLLRSPFDRGFGGRGEPRRWMRLLQWLR